MNQDEKTFKEKRHSILCANCGTPMVGANKYIISNDNIHVWYVCPRRKESGEKGCGHMIPVSLKKTLAGKNVEPILGAKIVGEVRSTENLTMIIEDNFETFQTWLHHNREKFKDKRVEVAVRIIEGEKSANI